MKKIIYILGIILLFTTQNSEAQRIGDLDGIFYQAVALDDEPKELVGIDIEAKPLFNREIGVIFTITKGLDGEEQWKEEHVTTTDKYGLFTLIIGRDSESSTSYTKLPSTYDRLLDIPWIDADQFLKVEIKTRLENEYKIVSYQKFMAVPYAFYTDDIADDAITTEKILNEEILAEDIAEGAVETSEILNETILAEDIGTGSVETSEILDATILNEDIADGTVDLTAKVTNILPVNNGGTGVDGSAATDGQLLIGNGTNGNFDLATLTAGTGINITNSAGNITIESPPVAIGSDGTFTIPVGSNGDINAGDAWYSPNSLKVAPIDGKPFEMGDIFLASANVDLEGCILSVYLQSIDGSGNANVQVVIFNPPSNGNVTLITPVTFKFLLVK